MLIFIILAAFFMGFDERVHASVSIDETPLGSSCPGGTLLVATYSPDTEFMVWKNGLESPEQAKASLGKAGVAFDSFINTVFFQLEKSTVYSYFKASSIQYENEEADDLPRACFHYDRRSKKSEMLIGTHEARSRFHKDPDAEVYCAGPFLVQNGKNVTDHQLCAEEFSQNCNRYHHDSGINPGGNNPRDGVCQLADGRVRWFMAFSPKTRCGMSLKKLGDVMIAHGCVTGMAHDGGGSVKGFFKPSHLIKGDPKDANRKIPVWIVGIISK